DEEIKMEPRPTRVMETTPILRTGSPRPRKARGRVLDFEGTLNRDEIRVERRMTNKIPGAPVTHTVANHAEKPEKFNGQNFKRWQQMMLFYLTTLNLAKFLKEIVPQVEPPKEGKASNQQAM
ncbi:hypothetical protein Tco_0778985, partial [Tanacetum coccineum]